MSYKELPCEGEDVAISSGIFVDKPAIQKRFRDHKNWCEIVIPRDFVVSNTYQYVFGVLSSVVGAWPPHQLFVKTLYAVEASWPKCYKVNASAGAVQELYDFEGFSLADYIIFDGSGKWGLYSDASVEYTAIGGASEVIELIVERLGGVAKLQSTATRQFVNQGLMSREISHELLNSIKWPEM